MLHDDESIDWTTISPPPLDVLMVLHSYMLSPRDFLEDSLRDRRMALRNAGFPWQYAEAYLTQDDGRYAVHEDDIRAYERATEDSWVMDDKSSTPLICPGCDNSIEITWRELYQGDIEQIEKGNTRMPFETVCKDCQAPITQTTLCLHKLSEDLRLLRDEAKPLAGTLLDASGRMTSKSDDSDPLLATASLAWQDCGVLDHLKQPNVDIPSVKELMSSSTPSFPLTRMMEVYENNSSPFAIDLVGAVVRQGTFISKMQDFDWIHSPAPWQHVKSAVGRYLGFFEVMRQHPDKVAVPTFDVDLIWHTHQLSPKQYYDFSLKYCNNVFIDHDDKIADGALTDSFGWTCKEYAKITGLPYDICLCWCCALLGADANESMVHRNEKRYLSRVKAMLGRSSANTRLSHAKKLVSQIQAVKFENDYVEAQNDSDSASQQSKREYFEHYVWHYPEYAPSPAIVAA